MGPAHHAATSESAARSAGPLLPGNLETVFTDVPPRVWGRVWGEKGGEGKGGGYNLHTQIQQLLDITCQENQCTFRIKKIKPGNSRK